jgi:hypothetical protein
MIRLASLAAAAALAMAAAAPARAADPGVTLFKIVTVKDDIVIGLTPAELARLGAADAGAVARAIATSGEMTAWQYAVRKSSSGELQQAPLRRIGVLANGSLRVEPYATPLTVVAP